MFGFLHKNLVYSRRVNALSDCFASLTSDEMKVLDIGCGDGLVSSKIVSSKKGVSIQGVDIVPREKGFIDISMYDGKTLPFADNTFDAVIFSDVLHHTDDPTALLLEASRVSRKFVIIKDHLCESKFDDARLRIMDWVGNARFGVPLPYKYFSLSEWNGMFSEMSLKKMQWVDELDLYCFPLNLIFSKGLHFVALLEKDLQVDQ